MSLKDLKSTLKNLKFGHDTPGGGSSGLPYIKPGLPEDSPAGEYLAGIARTSADFPLRGGTYSTIASTEDTVRISRFLTDFPKGPIFTSKQVGLQKSNPLIETGKIGSVLNTQTYNTNANLLAQVAEQGTGIHINRAGFNTNELDDDENKYAYIVKNKTTEQNRLVNLFDSKILENPNSIIGSNTKSLGITNDPNTLFTYAGGPDSNFGDGETVISRTTNTTNAPKGQIRPEQLVDINNLLGFSSGSYKVENTKYQQGYGLTAVDFIRPEKSPEGVPKINQFSNTMGYSALLAAKEDDMSVAKLIDFRTKTNSPQKRNYTDKLTNITTRIGIGSPGARTNAQRKGTNVVNYNGQDQVNMIPLYSDDTDPFNGKPEARDLIKFAFEVIDNDTPGKTTKAHFRAFLTNFSDNHSAEWNGQKYMGRGEKFYTYQGFDRQVSFQFKVAAQSKQEMLPLYQKLNYIVSSLYPDYSNKGFMRGNLHKLTIGEYFYRTPGIITSMNITVDDNYPWEIKYSEPETSQKFETKDFPNQFSNGSTEFENSNSDADMMELPQVLNVSVSFIPILNELPSLSKYTTDKDGEIIRNDKRGILISNDVGIQENFINRIMKTGITRTASQITPSSTISTPTSGIQSIPINYKIPSR